jgi:hypothetical protein
MWKPVPTCSHVLLRPRFVVVFDLLRTVEIRKHRHDELPELDCR